MSIHGAKARSPDCVFAGYAEINTTFWQSGSLPSGLYWPSGQYEPLDMIEQMKQANQKVREEEDFRLLYVALTRAQQAIFVSGWQRPRQRMEENSLWFVGKADSTLCRCNAERTVSGGWKR